MCVWYNKECDASHQIGSKEIATSLSLLSKGTLKVICLLKWNPISLCQKLLSPVKVDGGINELYRIKKWQNFLSENR